MSIWGEKLGRFGLARIGVGVSQQPPVPPVEQPVFYRSWRQGIITSNSAELLPEDAVALMVDMEADETDALVRGAGIHLFQDMTPRLATWLFEQTGLDFSTELICIDAPFLGYSSGGPFTFHSLAISNPSAAGWCAVNVAGILVFSNGSDKIYTRDAGSTTVTDITSTTNALPCQCIGTAFGRVFQGAYIDSVQGLISLGVRWNAASGSLTDYTGLGAGNEELISNVQRADRLEAIVPIGLQTVAFLCRQSLWVGYETGVSDRPADFQLRFAGLGCVSRDSAQATPGGVIYLSDAGVCLFDLNVSQVISDQINAQLLPIDYSRISQYRGLYDPTTQRYFLTTPGGIFIFEFPHGSVPARWFFRSFIADAVVAYTDQSGALFWDSVVGPWDLQTLTWEDMIIQSQNAPSLAFFGKGTKVGFESYAELTNMGTAFTADPVCMTRQPAQEVTNLQRTTLLEVQYRAEADAAVTFMAMDADGELTLTSTKTLPSTSGAKKRVLVNISDWAGMGADMQISYSLTTNCAIERIRRVLVPDGEATQAAI